MNSFEFCKLRSMAFIAAKSSGSRMNFHTGDFGKIIFSPNQKDKVSCNFNVSSDLAGDINNANYSLEYSKICNSTKKKCFYPTSDKQALLELLFKYEAPLKEAITLSCDNEGLVS